MTAGTFAVKKKKKNQLGVWRLSDPNALHKRPQVLSYKCIIDVSLLGICTVKGPSTVLYQHEASKVHFAYTNAYFHTAGGLAVLAI